MYFQTPKLPEGTHTIDIMVTAADDAKPYVLDYITTTGEHNSELDITRMAPSASTVFLVSRDLGSVAKTAGIIGGGVAGGIVVIILLALVVCVIVAKTRSRRSNQHEMQNTVTNPAGEGMVGLLSLSGGMLRI
jgi:hypothetical protein